MSTKPPTHRDPADDPLAPLPYDRDEPFEQGRPAAAAVPRTDARGKPMYKVLVPAPWTNAQGSQGTTWTNVGRAFATKDGWIIYINGNIAVSGQLVLKPDEES